MGTRGVALVGADRRAAPDGSRLANRPEPRRVRATRLYSWVDYSTRLRGVAVYCARCQTELPACLGYPRGITACLASPPLRPAPCRAAYSPRAAWGGRRAPWRCTGTPTGGSNPNATPYGAIGQCEGGFGFRGFYNAPPGAIARPGGGAFTAVSGVLGTSPNNVGIYAISTGSYGLVADGNGPATVGALIRGNGGGPAAIFGGNVQIQGSLTVTGSYPKSAAVPHPDGTHRRLYCVEAPEPVFEDFGEGRVENGQASIALDPDFAALVQSERYHVFLTSHDEVHLHVRIRTARGFEVRVPPGAGRAADAAAGRASPTFSWRVVAKRKDLAGPRLERVEVHQPAIPLGQGVPTLPTVHDTPAPSPRPGRER